MSINANMSGARWMRSEKAYMDSLESELRTLPKQEAAEIRALVKEHLDANKGNDINSTLSRLGDPEQIVASQYPAQQARRARATRLAKASIIVSLLGIPGIILFASLDIVPILASFVLSAMALRWGAPAKARRFALAGALISAIVLVLLLIAPAMIYGVTKP